MIRTVFPRLSLLQCLSLSFLVLAMAGCSTFHRDWRHAASTSPAPSDITGRWQGSWQSDVNGHHGRLRCLVTREGEGEYHARFHANYLKVFRFGYTVPLSVQEANGAFRFQGEADLGRLAGGRYTYEGKATRTEFFSAYQAKKDHGTFRMTRP